MISKAKIKEHLANAFKNEPNKISEYLLWVKAKNISLENLLKQDTIEKFLSSRPKPMSHSKYLFTRTYICPFDKTQFVVYKLYPSARDKFERTDEFFDIAIYENPFNDVDFCNYLTLEVRICPECLFASNNDEYFKSSTSYTSSFQPDAREVDTVLSDKSKRLEIAKDAGNLFTPNRTFEDTIISYRLGISTSSALYGANRRRNAIELTRIGNYALKSARLCQENNKLEEREKWLKDAFEYFKKTFDADIKGPAYYKSLYQLSALAIYFGEDVIASKCYEIFRILKEKEVARSLNIYSMRLRKAWQDREEYRKGKLT